MPENLAQVITKPSRAKEYRVSDHLASLRVAIEGATTRTMDYDPWGNAIAGSSGGERSTFNDQERDAETGLFDLSDRNLDPTIGEFSKPDRLMEKFRSVSPYNYCFANPVRLTDPDGMQACSIHFGEKIWGGGFVAGGAGIGAGALLKLAIDAFKGAAPVYTYTIGSQGEPIGVIDNRPLLNPPPPIIIIPGPRALLNPPPPIILNSDGKAGNKASAPPPPSASADSKADKSKERAIKSLETQLEEHTRKLADYKADPAAHDNKGFLSNPNISDEIRQKIYDSRVRSLEGQIKEFAKQIKNLKEK